MSYRTVHPTCTPPPPMTVGERTNDVIRLTPGEFNLFKEPRPSLKKAPFLLYTNSFVVPRPMSISVAENTCTWRRETSRLVSSQQTIHGHDTHAANMHRRLKKQETTADYVIGWKKPSTYTKIKKQKQWKIRQENRTNVRTSEYGRKSAAPVHISSPTLVGSVEQQERLRWCARLIDTSLDSQTTCGSRHANWEMMARLTLLSTQFHIKITARYRISLDTGQCSNANRTPSTKNFSYFMLILYTVYVTAECVSTCHVVRTLNSLAFSPEHNFGRFNQLQYRNRIPI
ncbi:hypothetical protein CBL_11938 [Carabus blaptoides fortunei]